MQCPVLNEVQIIGIARPEWRYMLSECLLVVIKENIVTADHTKLLPSSLHSMGLDDI